jgi:hypothetical protein
MPDGPTIQVMASVIGPVGRDVSALEPATYPFEGVLNSIEAIAATLAKTLDRVQPDKASVEFGIEVAVKEGVLTGLLVKGTTTGNLTVTLEWEKQKPKVQTTPG